jgi:hypothetical protein
MHMERLHPKRERDRIGQSGPSHHVQRQEVFLRWMAVSGRSRVLPIDQETLALRSLPTHCVGEPSVEPPTRLAKLGMPEASHVAIAIALPRRSTPLAGWRLVDSMSA